MPPERRPHLGQPEADAVSTRTVSADQGGAMPAERRLHPLSIGFWLAGQVRQVLFPMLFGVASLSFLGGVGIGVTVLVFSISLVATSALRYLTYRYRFEDSDLVIRSGLFFRSERTIPYSRVQNLDAVQSVFHRVLGVVDVKIETGGGSGPEAKMTVLPTSAMEELRHRIREGRGEAMVRGAAAGMPAMSPGGLAGTGSLVPPTGREAGLESDAQSTAPDGRGREPDAAPISGELPQSPKGRELLHLSPKELALHGLIQNRGVLLLAAATAGLMQQLHDTGLAAGVFRRIAGDDFVAWLGNLIDGLGAGGSGFAAASALSIAGLVLGLLIVLMALSVIWALVRLHDYRVVIFGERLRATFGLLTRVAATIPLRRIQTLTISEAPLHRWARCAAVGVQTAGNRQLEAKEQHRQWLAPIIRRDRLHKFLGEVIPELDTPVVAWRGVSPRAFRRILFEGSLVATGVAVPIYFLAVGWGAAVHAALIAWAVLYAKRSVQHLGWAVRDDGVWFKSGWLWRKTTFARFAKIQVVAMSQSPFDRLRGMARVRASTAGGSIASHKVDIPYMPVATAREVRDVVAAQAAQTAFRW